MGRAGLLMLLLLAALGTGARGHEGSGEPAGSPAPGPPELCLLPKAVGRCRAAFPRWWYNATSRACQRFTYGGCGANLNNFLAEDDCRVRCAAAGDGEDVNEIPQASHRVVQSADEESPGRAQPANNTFTYEESCAAPRLTGPCRAAFPRWYYDPAAGACKQFVYGGCKGNKNNYLQEELCLRQCRGAAGGAEGPEPGVHSTRAVALAVLLAVLVAVLLGSVVIFFVWLCRRSQELSLSVPWSPLDDKEYLMSNAYTL
ncbi:kunitz-type protease inhibitor 2 isoform X4 [Chelonia mydas]|uniref:kunitz-type protease inhibitor 2 isoform X4 n=1 Tax=Chelonia mydas TaxID=8469 RepID=UPI0018A1F068|nr:kunitz-type protease inhibitor 2 isoform X4 [Chelonia mydas]